MIKDKKGWELIDSIPIKKRNLSAISFANIKWKLFTDTKTQEEFHRYWITITNYQYFIDIKENTFSIREYYSFNRVKFNIDTTQKIRKNSNKFSILFVNRGKPKYIHEINFSNCSSKKDLSISGTAALSKIAFFVHNLLSKWKDKHNFTTTLPQLKNNLKAELISPKYNKRGYGEWRSSSNKLLIKQLYGKYTKEAVDLHNRILSQNVFVTCYVQYDCIKLKKAGWSYKDLYALHEKMQYKASGFADIFLTTKPSIIIKELNSTSIYNSDLYNVDYYLPFLGFNFLSQFYTPNNYRYIPPSSTVKPFLLREIEKYKRVSVHTKVNGVYIDSIPQYQPMTYSFTRYINSSIEKEYRILLPRIANSMYIYPEVWALFTDKEFSLVYIEEFIESINKILNLNLSPYLTCFSTRGYIRYNYYDNKD